MTRGAFVRMSRAGMAGCVCPPDGGAGGAPSRSRRARSRCSGRAAASVLSQALMFGLLPLAGQMLAPQPALRRPVRRALRRRGRGDLPGLAPDRCLRPTRRLRPWRQPWRCRRLGCRLGTGLRRILAAGRRRLLGRDRQRLRPPLPPRRRGRRGDACAARHRAWLGALVGFVAPALAGFAELRADALRRRRDRAARRDRPMSSRSARPLAPPAAPVRRYARCANGGQVGRSAGWSPPRSPASRGSA